MAGNKRKASSSSPNKPATKKKTTFTTEETKEDEICNNPIGFQFQVLHTDGRARYTNLTLPHYDCFTPMFMPVGTQGCVKGLTSEQLEEIVCQVIREYLPFGPKAWERLVSRVRRIAQVYGLEQRSIDRLWWVSNGFVS